jgi:hypothetical protein
MNLNNRACKPTGSHNETEDLRYLFKNTISATIDNPIIQMLWSSLVIHRKVIDIKFGDPVHGFIAGWNEAVGGRLSCSPWLRRGDVLSPSLTWLIF